MQVEYIGNMQNLRMYETGVVREPPRFKWFGLYKIWNYSEVIWIKIKIS